MSRHTTQPRPIGPYAYCIVLTCRKDASFSNIIVIQPTIRLDDDDHVDWVRLCLKCGYERAYCSFPRRYMSV